MASVQLYLQPHKPDESADISLHRNALSSLREKLSGDFGPILQTHDATSQSLTGKTSRQLESHAKQTLVRVVEMQKSKILFYQAGQAYLDNLSTRNLTVLDWFKESSAWLVRTHNECMDAYGAALRGEGGKFYSGDCEWGQPNFAATIYW